MNPEQALLGAVIIERLSIDALAGLNTNDFESVANREILATMRRLYSQGLPYSVEALMDAMGDEYTIQIAMLQRDGFEDFADIVAAEEKAKRYCRAVKDTALIREARAALAKASNTIDDDSREAAARVEAARALFDDVLKSAPSTLTTQADAVEAAFQSMGAPATEDAISTGITWLDNILGGGIRGNRLYVVGARPGVGKSALAMNVALNAARHKRPVLYTSLEMDASEIINREIARLALVDAAHIDTGRLTPAERESCERCRAELNDLPISYSTATTVDRIRTEALHVRPAIIVVDYLQLLDAGKRASNRTEEISAISRDLRLLSMEMQTPVVALSQLKRPDRPRPPVLSDLRESGAIEQDANTVILLHAPERTEEIDGTSVTAMYDMCEKCGNRLLVMNVPKNRGGKPCDQFAALTFNGAFMEFRKIIPD